MFLLELGQELFRKNIIRTYKNDMSLQSNIKQSMKTILRELNIRNKHTLSGFAHLQSFLFVVIGTYMQNIKKIIHLKIKFIFKMPQFLSLCLFFFYLPLTID